MKPALYLCIKNPFTERDLGRMGVAFLERHFDLRILDCTPWLMPVAYQNRGSRQIAHPRLRTIRNLREFKSRIDIGGYAVDYVGQFSPASILMFDALRARGIKLVVIDSGAYPLPDVVLKPRSLPQKIAHAFLHGGLRLHLNARINRLLLRALPDQRPDFALVAGSWWQHDPRFNGARRKIEAHSFDYERLLETESSNTSPLVAGKYAVYLDEDISDHEDNAEMDMAAPASAARFYPALSALFDAFEARAGMRVVIAGYPSRAAEPPGRFGAREVVYNGSAELIRHADLVFAHASTAISFAVLWRRPLVFLTSSEIRASWYQPWIAAPQKLLGACLVDVDADPMSSASQWQHIDESAYADYRHTFIKSPASPDKSLWEIFLQIREGEEQ